MLIVNGTKVILRGRYSDFTDHLNGQVVTVVDNIVDALGYVVVEDSEGTTWYVQAIDVCPYEG